MKKNSVKGFTLLEILLVIAVVSLLGVAGVSFYVNFARSLDIKGATDMLISDLKLARSHAVNGERALRWGVHVVNGATDYYEVFSTPTDYSDPAMTTTSSVALPNGVRLTDPPESSSRDIVFAGVSGTTTATIVNLASSVKNTTVTVTALGVIY